jgi:hypothetical protein
MDPLHGFMLLEVWTVPTWAFAEAPKLAPHLVVLPAHLHVQNPLNPCLNMYIGVCVITTSDVWN